MLLMILEVVVWGFVIYCLVTSDGSNECQEEDCECCPFPCDEHKKK